MKPAVQRLLAAAAVVLAAGGVRAESCSDTNVATPFLTGCAGSFAGTLSGAPAELATLESLFGGPYLFVGSSNEADFGPFTANPQVAFNLNLSFDLPETGVFVLGLVSNGQHSFYRFNTKRRIGGLDFDSLEGVATTPQGNPVPLDYAVLYRAAAVPEPTTSAMLAAGALALLGWRRRLRRE